MKMSRKPGDVWYDQLHEELLRSAVEDGIADHSTHECSDACAPPSEEALITFLRSLTAEQRTLVQFLMFISPRGLTLPLNYWTTPPAELTPPKGTH